MKIVVLDGYTENPGDLSWEGLSKLGEVTVYNRTRPEDVLSRIGDAQAIYTNKTVLSREIIMPLPNVRFIGVLATGYNVVDVQAAREKGIAVCNIPTYGTDAVAQYVFALLLEICHHVGHHNEQVQKGRWTACPDFCFWDYPLMELKGKTMGLIGFGRIGQRTGEIAKAFGMQVIAYDHFVKAPESVSFETLLSQSDVISLHCPLFPETKGIICEESISRMKDGVILINTSRGPLINERDLAKALKTGKVAFAAVDVVETEPIREDCPLLHHDNCLITPHIAWAPKESRQRLMDIAVRNLDKFLQGTPENIVNG